MAIGLFGYAFWRLLRAAVGHGPEESDDGLERLKGLDKAVSVDGALAAVAKASYGKVLLGIVAAGTIAFGAYSIADARYRRV